MVGKKEVYGDFEFIPINCNCPCHSLINLNKKRFKEYENYGYPKFINGHWIRTEEAKFKHLEKNGFKKNFHPWNFDLDKEIDKRIKTISEKLKGRTLSEDHIQHLRENHWDNSKENNPNWNGGISFGQYCPKFNNIKKEEIRNLYSRKCVLCEKLESENLTKKGKLIKLHVHHIDYNKDQGCEKHQWRLVPLCLSCHMKTNNGNRNEWENKIKNVIKIGE